MPSVTAFGCAVLVASNQFLHQPVSSRSRARELFPYRSALTDPQHHADLVLVGATVVDTRFQVLNAIMQSGTENERWDTLYSIAVKAYGLEAHFTPKQADKYGAWRQAIIDEVAADDDAYFRPATYDAVLSTLFPDMSRGIATGYGRVTRELYSGWTPG